MEKLFENQGTLGLFLIFFIPGFVTLKVYDLLIPGEQRDFSKSLFDAVAYSSLNFAALLWLIALVRSGSLTPWQWYLAMFFLLIGIPAVWPAVFLQIRKHPIVAQRIASPNARVWDDIFAKRTPYWVIVHLKDQRRIGGLYGGKSYTSHSPAPPEIFLEQVWRVDEDGGFTGSVVESTSGILIMGSEILALEFFRYN
jgi:Family of unknown function (DUF6338)